MKTCKRCLTEKDLSLFPKVKQNSDGHSGSCKECMKPIYKSYRDKTREKYPTMGRDYHIRRLYGLTSEEYEALLDYQDGKCYICGKECASGRKLSVDHDHDSGAIRGLLCITCNKYVVGNLNIYKVRAMLNYMENPPADSVFGYQRKVPTGMEKPKKRRKRRVSTTRYRSKGMG